MVNDPQGTKEFLKTLLSFQKQNGSALHQFNPLTLEGNEGDSLEREDRPHYYSDDHLWSILCVTAYIKETGDTGFLDEVIPYYEKDKQGKPIQSAPVMDHVKRALNFTRNDTGKHGLPLLGFADWNDTVNLPTGAVSFFTANLYGWALREFINLLEYLGQPGNEYSAAYGEMKSRFEQHGWDGEWYVRYFDEAGNPLGSSKNTYGQIYLNGQSWPVLSGFASLERAQQAMQSVYEKLNTKHGIKLSAPGFNGFAIDK
jgi:cellobiose phosphorylase